MTSRIEKKFVISDPLSFYKFINAYNGNEIYYQRKILSIYFDNEVMQSYSDADEGTRPRRKIRLRKYYPVNFILNKKKLSEFFNQSFSLEKKITSFNNNYKIVNKIIFNNNYLNLIDKQYGFLRPVSIVLYDRRYFKILNDRITFDFNIRYFTVTKDNSFFFKNILKKYVVEFKAGQNNFLSQYYNFSNLQSRYSKYLSSI